MKYFFLTFFLVISPVSVFAAPQIFLDADQNIPFSSHKWTSETTPNQTADILSVKYRQTREDILVSQIPNSTEIKNTITDLYESQPEAV